MPTSPDGIRSSTISPTEARPYSPTFPATNTSTGVQLEYSSVSATYQIVASTDYCVNCTTGTFTVTLPTASGRDGQAFIIKNSGTGVITIATTSSQMIDANASGALTLNQYDSLSVMSDGANWIII